MYVLSIVVCPSVLFILAIVWSVLLRYTDSDYTFGIFKLFLSTIVITPQSIWFEPAYMYYIMYGEYLHLSRICITFIPDNILT
jgi:hypothetical protein